mmetsp:Transcript_24249/g.34761  ORF Transcript_24249/g.34761 Transcript_24249/m.34761 type:complete len:301 (+) Transcript_24249:63-965(+)
MADLDSLINSKISLISHQDLRYDGTLFSINTTESSIVLKEVQCLGTEDRVTDPSKKVASNTSVIAFVTFSGNDIKDLYVHESSTTETTESVPVAPAPPSTAQKEQKVYQPPKPTSESEQNKGSGGQPKARREPRAEGTAGTGAHLLHMKEKKGPESTQNIQVTGDFDFEAGLNIFKKDEVLAKVAKDKESSESAPEDLKYKKDDFFDSLSSGQMGGASSRLTHSQERVLNQDTFGAVALHSNNYRRGYGGGGGGRSGGGRGRGRGGGRYYNNNANVDGRGGGRGRGRHNVQQPTAAPAGI